MTQIIKEHIFIVILIGFCNYAHSNSSVRTYCAEQFKRLATELPKTAYKSLRKSLEEKAKNGLLERILFLESKGRFKRTSRFFKKLKKNNVFRQFLEQKIITGVASDLQDLSMLKIYVALYGVNEELTSQLRRKQGLRLKDYYARLQLEAMERQEVIRKSIELGLFNTSTDQLEHESSVYEMVLAKDPSFEIQEMARQHLHFINRRQRGQLLEQAVIYSLRPLVKSHNEVSLFIKKVLEFSFTEEVESLLSQIVHATPEPTQKLGLFLRLVKQVEEGVPELSDLANRVRYIVLHFATSLIEGGEGQKALEKSGDKDGEQRRMEKRESEGPPNISAGSKTQEEIEDAEIIVEEKKS